MCSPGPVGAQTETILEETETATGARVHGVAETLQQLNKQQLKTGSCFSN